MSDYYSTRPIPRRGVEIEGSIKGLESFINIPIPISTKFSIPLKELYPTRGNFTITDRIRTNIAAMSRDWLYVNIKLTPIWAREFPTDPKSPPAPEYWIDYANAAIELKKQFPQIASVGFMNEPNMPYEASNPDYFGCWMRPGEASTPEGIYNAGVRYSKFLKLVGTEVKKVFPDIIIIGGDLFCDVNPQAAILIEFIKGMVLENPPYDYNGIHAYYYYYRLFRGAPLIEMTDPIDRDNVFSTYFTIASNLKEITGKRSIFTETAVIRKQKLPDTPEFQTAQKDWMVYLKKHVAKKDEWNNPVVSFMWYCLINTWEWCGMLNYPSKSPRPVYDEFVKGE